MTHEVNINDGAWHLDKRVNLATIITIATLLIGIAGFLNATRNDVETNARTIRNLDHHVTLNQEAIEALRAKDGAARERLARVEKSIEATNQLLQRILVSIDRLNDRMDRSERRHSFDGGAK